VSHARERHPGTPTPTATGPNTTAILLGTLGALGDLGLIIAGVQNFVDKDGDLVKDANRPTAVSRAPAPETMALRPTVPLTPPLTASAA